MCDQRLLGTTVKNTDVVQPCSFPFKETNQEPERPNGFSKITQPIPVLNHCANQGDATVKTPLGLVLHPLNYEGEVLSFI